MNNKLWVGSTVLLLSMLACEPIFAVGWREILIVLLLAAFLLGPPIYRFFRRLERSGRQKDK
ncbi:MAG TPA: hypothetical protein VJ987_13325 [Anaerolineales bacterium]|nr:hypothetical protein [Anaerolineales bacterium]